MSTGETGGWTTSSIKIFGTVLLIFKDTKDLVKPPYSRTGRLYFHITFQRRIIVMNHSVKPRTFTSVYKVFVNLKNNCKTGRRISTIGSRQFVNYPNFNPFKKNKL